MNIQERAWDLYQQIQAQRATLRSYESALAFVRVRQSEPNDIEPVARELWEIAQRIRGDCNPTWMIP